MGFLQVEPLEYVHPSTYETWMTRGIPKNGDVLFTTEAPLANVAQLDTSEKVVFAQRIIVLQPFSSDLDTTFLKYLLLSDSAQQRILEKGTGATVQGIKASLLKLIEIKYPSILEQQRIVAILDETFEGIATAKASAEKNLQSTWELFEGYLESLFPLGVTGTGVRPLGEIASFRNGVNFTKQSKGQSVPIIGVKDFKKNFWAPMEELDSVTMDGQLSAIDAVQAGDILSVRSNGNPELIGRCILVPEHEGGVTHSGFTIRIRVESAVALPQYVCHYLKSQAARRELVAGGRRSSPPCSS
jgi:type I restriction enzyme S subunit